MRAPSKEPLLFVGYNAEQLRQIAKSLVAVGIDLDAQIVRKKVFPDAWWWNADEQERPLRDVLRDIAWIYAAHVRGGLLSLGARAGFDARTTLFDPRTPKERADELQESVAALETALDLLMATDLGEPHPCAGDERARLEHRRAIEVAMTREIVERRERIAKLRGMGGSSSQNARTLHNHCWRELATLWLGITKGKGGKYRRKHLSRFLFDCAQPIFPDETTETALDSFVRNFFRSAQG